MTTTTRTRRALPLLAALALLAGATPVAAAFEPDDAGTGGDAPDVWQHALDVPLGPFAGVIDGASNDWVDWYRVVTPPGVGLRITLESDRYLRMDARADDGKLLGYAGFARGTSTLEVRPIDGAVRFGVIGHPSHAGPTKRIAYDVHLDTFPLPDVTVTGITIRDVPGSLVERDVTLHLANLGDGAADSAHVSVWVSPARADPPDDGTVPDGPRPAYTYSVRLVGRGPITLPADGTTTRSFRWDTTGQVGDMDVRAVITHRFDRDASNNVLVERTSVLADGGGVGVDAMNRASGAGAFLASAGAYTRHDGETTGASVWGGTIGAAGWVRAGWDREGAPSARACVGLVTGNGICRDV